MKTNKFFLLTLLTFIFLNFISCKKIDKNSFVNLKDSFYWVKTNADSQPQDIEEGLYDSDFKKLDNMRSINLKKLVGLYGEYIWLKAEIDIPENYKDIDLAFFTQFIHFANKIWFNNHFFL